MIICRKCDNQFHERYKKCLLCGTVPNEADLLRSREITERTVSAEKSMQTIEWVLLVIFFVGGVSVISKYPGLAGAVLMFGLMIFISLSKAKQSDVSPPTDPVNLFGPNTAAYPGTNVVNVDAKAYNRSTLRERGPFSLLNEMASGLARFLFTLAAIALSLFAAVFVICIFILKTGKL